MKPVTNNRREFNHYNQRPDEMQRPDKNMQDLSHEWKGTFSMGQLIPILTKETLPGDNWSISTQFMARFAPLYLPIFHRCTLTIDYWYITNRILWSGWEDFITQADDLEWPYLEHPTQSLTPTTDMKAYHVAQYMGFPSALPGDLVEQSFYPISALPLSAYLKVFDEYYRNPQIQEEQWFDLQAGDNSALFYSAGPPVVNKIQVLRNLWNRDYFTSALPTPTVGDDILVPMVKANLESFGTVPVPVAGPYRWRDADDDSLHAAGDVVTSNTAWGAGDTGSSIGGDRVYLDIQETAAPLREFRLAARLLEFMEKLMRTGQRYNDFIKGWFKGVEPDAGVIQRPVWFGRASGTIVISEVLSTAQTINATEDTTTPLGAYAGQALAMETSNKFEYYCKEHGFVMALACIRPRTSYFQGLNRMWFRTTPLEYAWEQFAGIGDQAITRKELALSFGDYTANYNDIVFGYIPRYDEYRWADDVVCGQMRDIWLSFHLGRLFDQSTANPIPLNTDFITCEPRVDDVFQVAAAQRHEIYAYIYHDIKVWRQLPKYGIPML